ncbi:hypothetical protein EON63_20920, partial [archaeon]
MHHTLYTTHHTPFPSQNYPQHSSSPSPLSLYTSTLMCIVRDPPMEGEGGAQLLSLHGGVKVQSLFCSPHVFILYILHHTPYIIHHTPYTIFYT